MYLLYAITPNVETFSTSWRTQQISCLFSPLPFPVSAVLELDEVRGQLVCGLDGLHPLVAHHRLRPRVILHELLLDLHTNTTKYFVNFLRKRRTCGQQVYPIGCVIAPVE